MQYEDYFESDIELENQEFISNQIQNDKEEILDTPYMRQKNIIYSENRLKGVISDAYSIIDQFIFKYKYRETFVYQETHYVNEK